MFCVRVTLTSCVISGGETRGDSMMAAGRDREQLETLRRQVEEDYKLDVAAIERFQRRFTGETTTSPAIASPPVTTATVSEIRGAAVVPIPEPVGQFNLDELTGSLRIHVQHLPEVMGITMLIAPAGNPNTSATLNGSQSQLQAR